MEDHKTLQEHQSTAPSGAAKLPSGSSPPNKRDSDEGKPNSTGSNKRPKILVEDGGQSDSSNSTKGANPTKGKTIVTPTGAASEEIEPTTGGAAATLKGTTPSTEILDLAETVGLKAGDEIEVQWEIHATDNRTDDDENGKQKTDESNEGADEPNVSVHWWKATLMEYDGKTTDSVAVRSLLYEARPDLGFPEPSKEDVVFLGNDVLVTSTDVDSGEWERNPDNVRQMPYRRIQGQEVYSLNDDELDAQLNSMLMGAFQKNQAVWNAIPAAQKAVIAEQIQQKKEKLKKALQESKHRVITSETIKDILAQTF